MAVYTYDEEADALYVLLVSESEARVARTVELTDHLHVDLDASDREIGIEILYATRENLGEVFETLTERQRTILELRAGIRERSLTLEEVGKRFGLTRERIRQIEKQALARLRRPPRNKPLPTT